MTKLKLGTNQPFRWLNIVRKDSRQMANYSKVAPKQLDKLPDAIAEMLLDALDGLAENPRPDGCKKMKGRIGYRIRKGDYRILYDVLDDVLVVRVVGLGHRREVYK